MSDSKQFFHCFGCGQHGDAISFLRELNGLSFREAIETLAAEVGIRVDTHEETPEERASRERQRDAKKAAYTFLENVGAMYHASLLALPSSHPVRAYVRARGFTDADVRTWWIGYAPDEWDWLVQKTKPDIRLSEYFGLIIPKKSGGFYDRFRNRLVFPIRDVQDRVVGFSGRVLPGSPDEAPKYINTPESRLYRKGEHVYGLGRARRGVRSRGFAVVVEGNTDVVAMHRAELDNVVAPLGTAFTDAQARLLRRFADEVVFLFDGDVAGRTAARNALEPAERAGLHARLAFLPDGEDPDSLLQHDGGRDVIDELIDGAQGVVAYLIEHAIATNRPDDHGRAAVLKEVAPVLARVADSRERALYEVRLARDLGLSEVLVAQTLRAGGDYEATAKLLRVGGSEQEALPLDERHFVAACILHPDVLPYVENRDALDLVSHDGLRSVAWSAATLMGEHGRIDPSRLLEWSAECGLQGWVARVLMADDPWGIDRARELVVATVRRWQGMAAARHRAKMIAAMAEAFDSGDAVEARRIQAELSAMQ